ncbi:MAG: hypothetical protein JOZ80_08970 [Acidobacteriaceae bacterium]|nr:hypothetical protein [Acidobacteriaceae bacterium]
MLTTLRNEQCDRFAAVLGSVLVLSLMILFASQTTLAQQQPNESAPTKPAQTFVIGFVGGFVHSNDVRHSEVQMARRLQAAYGDTVRVQVFRNRQRAKAHQAVISWFHAADQAGAEPRILMFGHSWGASAVVYLARELEQDGIPVALTVQVDSVQKHGEDDSMIPANVAEAINFYQRKGLIHGRREIVAADPVRTAVLGNFQFEYKKTPAECRAYPWYNRLLFKGHTSIECDNHVWSQVDRLIETRLLSPPQPTSTQVAAQLLK